MSTGSHVILSSPPNAILSTPHVVPTIPSLAGYSSSFRFHIMDIESFPQSLEARSTNIYYPPWGQKHACAVALPLWQVPPRRSACFASASCAHAASTRHTCQSECHTSQYEVPHYLHISRQGNVQYTAGSRRNVTVISGLKETDSPVLLISLQWGRMWLENHLGYGRVGRQCPVPVRPVLRGQNVLL